MSKYVRAELEKAHKHSSHHRQEILDSELCGCFYCKLTYAPNEINKWVDDDSCAICPKCGIDSVIGDASNLPVTDNEFLKEMHNYWF